MSYTKAPFPAIKYFSLPISLAIVFIESIGLPDAITTSVPLSILFFIVFFVFDSFVSATAGLRMDKRDAGQAPNNAYEQYLDNHFPDERMNEIYANSQKVTK